METFDAIIVGAGVAGSRLLAHLLDSPWRTRKILVIERELARPRDHVLAFWSAGPTGLDPLVTHRWRELRVIEGGRAETRPLREHVYAATSRRAVVEAGLAAAKTCANVHVLEGMVEEVVDGAGEARVRVGERWFAAAWVFDSRRPGPQAATVRLVQRFVGWTIEGPPALDPGAATLFDFRTGQVGGASFLYVLPFAAGRALVEHVFVGPEDGPAPDQELALRTYLEGQIGGEWRIVARERGSSALTDAWHPRRLGRRIRAIGIRGGRLKPSSGYALTRIERDCAAIVGSLARRGDPFAGARERAVYRWLDAIFLWALARAPERAPGIFAALLRRPEATLRFLDERARALDVVVLLVALPTWLFVRAALQWIRAPRALPEGQAPAGLPAARE